MAFTAAAAGAVYHSFTPPWPLQAPLFDVAEVVLPSLHTPVVAGALALSAAFDADCADSFSFLLLELFAEELPS